MPVSPHQHSPLIPPEQNELTQHGKISEPPKTPTRHFTFSPHLSSSPNLLRVANSIPLNSTQSTQQAPEADNYSAQDSHKYSPNPPISRLISTRERNQRTRRPRSIARNRDLSTRDIELCSVSRISHPLAGEFQLCSAEDVGNV